MSTAGKEMAKTGIKTSYESESHSVMSDSLGPQGPMEFSRPEYWGG